MKITIIGAGCFGTALAFPLAQNAESVLLWDCDASLLQDLTKTRTHENLPTHCTLPENVEIVENLQNIITQSDVLLLAVPSYAFRDALTKIKQHLGSKEVPLIAWGTKGFDAEQEALLSDTVTEIFGKDIRRIAIAGPTFAKDLAEGKSTKFVVASDTIETAEDFAKFLQMKSTNVSTTNDLVGAQIGGAVKNVIAVAVGISNGSEHSANACAALITQGFAEMCAFGKALGAQEETLSGLAGLGDLILTCTNDQSRNYRFGTLLGQGKSQEEALAEIDQEVAAMEAVKVLHALAQKHNIEMPLCEKVYEVLYEGCVPSEALGFRK